jgi:hypothetical protein
MVERVPFDGGFLLYLVAHIVHIQVPSSLLILE